jgi:sugar phosphate isomerase/epimerase
MSHPNIRIGTLVKGDQTTASYIKQILPHGFESFQISFWKQIGDVDLKTLARQVVDLIGDKAIISSLGIFGNPLQDEITAKDWTRCIEAAPLFGAKIVAGFTGAIEGKPLPESLPRFKEVFTPLARQAEDHGVRIAFENCDMGGYWRDVRWNIAHSPTGWEMMFNEVPSEALGLEWEPCHQMVSMVEPLPQLRKWIKKVYHVHGKDATIAWDVLREYGTRGGKPWIWHRTPGFGDTNWTDVISILRQGDYKGTIDIEGWHDPVYKDDLEMTGQVHGLNYLKQCRGGAFIANPVV